jgi:hypothetical protein
VTTILATSRDRELEYHGKKDSQQRPSFKAALRFWCKLGWISFGGTAAHIAIAVDQQSKFI